MTTIIVDEINNATGISLNGAVIDVVGPAGANEVLIGTGVDTLGWSADVDRLGYNDGNSAVIISNTPSGADDILTTTSSTSCAWISISLNSKENVRAASSVNGTLATDFADGSTIDGVLLATNDRILIRSQTLPTENGIYIVQAAGAPVRAADLDTGAEAGGVFVFVLEGTLSSGTGYYCSSGIVDTDFLLWNILTRDLSANARIYALTITNITNAAGLGVKYIKIAPGTYNFTSGSINITANDTIFEGSGIDSTIFVGDSGTGSYDYILQITGNNCVIKDITFNSNSNKKGIFFNNCNESIVSNCKIINQRIDIDGASSNVITGNNNKILNNEMILVSNNVAAIAGYIDLVNANKTIIKGNNITYTGSVNRILIRLTSGIKNIIANNTIIKGNITVSSTNNIICDNYINANGSTLSSGLSLVYNAGICKGNTIIGFDLSMNANFNTIIKDNEFRDMTNATYYYQLNVSGSPGGFHITDNYITGSTKTTGINLVSPVEFSTQGLINRNFYNTIPTYAFTQYALPINEQTSNLLLSCLDNSIYFQNYTIDIARRPTTNNLDIVFVNNTTGSSDILLNDANNTIKRYLGSINQFIYIRNDGVSNLDVQYGDYTGTSISTLQTGEEIVLQTNGTGSQLLALNN